MAANPLLEPALDIAFDAFSPEHVVPAISQLLRQAEAAVQQIESSDQPTYENTLQAMEDATEGLSLAMSIVGHLEAVNSSDELRRVYNEIKPKVSAFYNGLPLRPQLYAVIAAVSLEGLDPAKRRHLEQTKRQFAKHGAALGSDDKVELEKINLALTKACTRYAQNLLDSTTAFRHPCNESDLEGMPQDAIALVRQDGDDDHELVLTLKAPVVNAVLTYADSAAVRETIWHGYALRGRHVNDEIALEILQLRRKKAAVLGFDDFADFALSDRMAKSGTRASEFIGDLIERTQTAFEAERKELQSYRDELEGDASAPIQPWDVAYYAQKLRLARYAFDEEELRPYFEVGRVLSGLFQVAQAIYGIRIQPREQPTWHTDVRSYGIYDGERLIATFAVDLYPRDRKRAGAWMRPIRSSPGDAPQIGVFVANVSPPIEGRPALLRHREVQTLFHEFGHLLHHALSEVPIRSLAGTNVAWDFVELPSQIMENFCWERKPLDLFARHWQSDAPIPSELLEKLQRTRTFRAGSANMRQLGFAMLDLRLHRELNPEELNATSLLQFGRDVLQEFYPAQLPAEHAIVTSFPHLFGDPTGYAGGYYSYKWAEVLDADAFTRFQEDGVLSREVGDAFRQAILSRGDLADADQLYIDFMGREPQLDPLLKRYGLQ